MWIRFALFNAALAAILTSQPRNVLVGVSLGPRDAIMSVGEQKNFVSRATTVVPSAKVVYHFEMADTSIAVIDSVTAVATARSAGTTTLRVRVTASAEGFVSNELTTQVSVVVK